MAKKESEIPKIILEELDEFGLTDSEAAYVLEKLKQDSFTFYTPNHKNLRLQLWTEPDKKLRSGRDFPGESKAAKFAGEYYATDNKREALHIYCSKMFRKGEICDNQEYVKKRQDREYLDFVAKIKGDEERFAQLKADLEAGKLNPVQVEPA